jgi:uncharacterized spore protein YtfJ
MASMATETSPLEVIRTAVTSTAEKVYIEPIRQDGLTVIPAASVGGGGGGGGGSGGPQGQAAGTGEGGGFGLKAKPAGAFVIKEGKVRWRPAIDVNKVILGGQIVAVTALLVARAIILGRARMAHVQALAHAAGGGGRWHRGMHGMHGAQGMHGMHRGHHHQELHRRRRV